MKIAIIMIHYGQVSVTKQSLIELSKKIGEHQLILINNTRDDITELGKIIKGTHIINNQANLGFAKAVNIGISYAAKDNSITHYFLMNNDLHLEIGGMSQLLLTFNKTKNVGIVAPVLHSGNMYDWGGKYNRWSGMVKHKNWPNKPKTMQSVGHVAGAAMLIPKEVIEKVGLFDERFFLYFEDLDFCLRVKESGYSICINCDVVASHMISTSSSRRSRTLYQWASHLKFVTKHLFKYTYPTAYLMDLFIYPLWLLKG